MTLTVLWDNASLMLGSLSFYLCGKKLIIYQMILKMQKKIAACSTDNSERICHL